MRRLPMGLAFYSPACLFAISAAGCTKENEVSWFYGDGLVHVSMVSHSEGSDAVSLAGEVDIPGIGLDVIESTFSSPTADGYTRPDVCDKAGDKGAYYERYEGDQYDPTPGASGLIFNNSLFACIPYSPDLFGAVPVCGESIDAVRLSISLATTPSDGNSSSFVFGLFAGRPGEAWFAFEPENDFGDVAGPLAAHGDNGDATATVMATATRTGPASGKLTAPGLRWWVEGECGALSTDRSSVGGLDLEISWSFDADSNYEHRY
jgi:hypothetical protein